MIKVDDVVFVLRIAAFRGTERIPARVIAVHEDSFDVEATRPEGFDEDGHDRMALEKRAKGRTWE